MPKRKAKKAKTKKKSRKRILREGTQETLTVRRFMGDISASLPRNALRYLKVSVGDKLKMTVRNGRIEVTSIPTLAQEIDKYVSQR